MKPSSYILLLLFVALLAGCSNNSKTKNSTIVTGKEKSLVQETVSAEGGEIVVDKPGDPLDGFTIKIPGNAYDDDQKFIVTTAPITEHKLGPDFHPLSPLITVANGGAYSDSVMILSIPADVPKGEFAMAFLYDDETGKLEGMPLLASDGKKVVVATNNFAHSSKSGPFSSVAAGIEEPDPEAVNKIIVASAKESILTGKYDSGFRPGVDDIPSPNLGSCYQPGGVCSGQSLAAMWYYTKKKGKDGPGLYRFLDNDGKNPTPDFSLDDARAIKFSSMMQGTFFASAVPKVPVVVLEAISEAVLPESATRNAFAFAIKMTQEPQFVGINKGVSAHALIVYKVDGDTLYVADPNFPKKTDRRIVYNRAEGKFASYHSAERADLPGTDYIHFYYFAKSCLFSWHKGNDFWEAMEEGTLGKGKFPEFTVMVLNKDDEFVPLTDGFETGEDGVVTLSVRSPGFENKFWVYDGNNKSIPVESSMCKLPPGEQQLGIVLLDAGGYWAGFKRFKIKVLDDKSSPGTMQEGEARVFLKINGNDVIFDHCPFRIDGKSFSILGPKEAIEKQGDNFSVSCSNFSGVGQYNDISGVWNSYTTPPTGSFKSTLSGTMTVSKFDDGNFVASFSFLGAGGDIFGGVKVDGEIYYRKQ